MSTKDKAEEPAAEVVAYDPSVFPDLTERDPAAMEARMARRFEHAGTIDDLFGALEGRTSQDMVGRVLEIRAVEWWPYQSDRGTIPMAVCDAVDVQTGEVVEFPTTSMALTAFIKRAEVIGALPFTARVVKRQTRSGQTALNFERV